jgi:hypothetical protein
MFNQMTNLDSKTSNLHLDNALSNLDTQNNLDNNIISDINSNMNSTDNLEDNHKLIMYTNLQIKKFIDEFTEDQQIEIFKIIKYYDEYYSSNNNGVFINLDNLSDKCKNDIISFINYSNQNKECLQEMELNIDKYKQLIDDSGNENN